MAKQMFKPQGILFGVIDSQAAATFLELFGFSRLQTCTVGKCPGIALYHRLIGMAFSIVLFTQKKKTEGPTAPFFAFEVEDLDAARAEYFSLPGGGSITVGQIEKGELGEMRMLVTSSSGMAVTVFQPGRSPFDLTHLAGSSTSHTG